MGRGKPTAFSMTMALRRLHWKNTMLAELLYTLNLYKVGKATAVRQSLCCYLAPSPCQQMFICFTHQCPSDIVTLSLESLVCKRLSKQRCSQYLMHMLLVYLKRKVYIVQLKKQGTCPGSQSGFGMSLTLCDCLRADLFSLNAICFSVCNESIIFQKLL